ncbi:MAG: hypothetical protein WCD38_06725 [Candidatus Tumulicola sp.]
MNRFTVASIAAASAAVAILTACSGGPQSGSTGLPQTTAGAAARVPRPEPQATGSFLYVADYSKGSIEILQRVHQRWLNAGAIKESVLEPRDAWVDKSHNLYVANGLGPVTEYDSSGKLIFGYESAGSGKAVTTDNHGNVFVVGVDVNEYPQGIDNAFSCEMPNAEPVAIAVDKDGNVFVGAFLGNGRGKIVEYVGGLVNSKCDSTRLPIPFSSAPHGIAIDKEGNLLATDPDRGVGDIDVIAPPYTSITRTISTGGPWPVSVSLNKANTRMYVSDSSLNMVHVMTYPAGAILTSLGPTEGLTQPDAAVDGNNFVP